MRHTHHAAVRAGLVAALSLVVTLEGMPTCALAATPADAPSAADAHSEAPSSQTSSATNAASTTGAQDKAATPAEKRTAAPVQSKAATPTQDKAAAPAPAQKSAPAPQPQQTKEPVTATGAEKASQAQQTTDTGTAAVANQDAQAQAKRSTPAQASQSAGSAPAEAAAPAAAPQDARAQSVSVGVQTVDEQGKSVKDATVSVNAGAERRSSNAAGTYDVNQGETITVVADAPTYAHVEQTFVVKGSPIAVMLPKSQPASVTNPPANATKTDASSQSQAAVDRMAQEFDASYDDINLLAFAPQYNSGISVTNAIRQRLAGDASEGLTVSVASSSDASVIATNGTVGRDSTTKVVPYETTGSSECSFTFSLDGAQATTSAHTVQVGYWSTDADGTLASTDMQRDVALPSSFRANDGTPLIPPSTVPDDASFTWKLVSSDSAFSLTTDANDGTQKLVARGQNYATSAMLEAAMIPSKVEDYDFYFYPIRSFMLSMDAGSQVAAVDDPLHPTVGPRRAPSRPSRPGTSVMPTLMAAVVPTSVESPSASTPSTSPTSDGATPASSVVSPDVATGAEAAETAPTRTTVTSGTTTSTGAHGTQASGTIASPTSISLSLIHI